MAVTGDNGIMLTFSAASDAVTGTQIIDNIQWTEGATAGDEAKVTDAAGNVIFEAKLSAANTVVTKNFQGGLQVDGITIATLGSGKIAVALR